MVIDSKALELASEALSLAFRLDLSESYSDAPCCAAFSLARAILDASGLHGFHIVNRAVDTGEWSPDMLREYATPRCPACNVETRWVERPTAWAACQADYCAACDSEEPFGA